DLGRSKEPATARGAQPPARQQQGPRRARLEATARPRHRAGLDGEVVCRRRSRRRRPKADPRPDRTLRSAPICSCPMSHSFTCRACSAPLSDVFADLGSAPLSNAYLDDARLFAMEPTYPLCVFVCSKCLLVQLPALQTPQAIFGDEY